MSFLPSTTTNKKRNWNELRSIAEYTRKLSYQLNIGIPSNITFRDITNEFGQKETRIYFLAGNYRHDTTIKYINMQFNQQTDVVTEHLLFSNNNSLTTSESKTQLSKEEQLLRERKRCSFNGITSYFVDASSTRLVFSERSDLFYFDDSYKSTSSPCEISTTFKGAIDVKLCPYNSNLVSYVVNGNLWVHDLKSNVEMCLTDSSQNETCGVPSFVVQEEFDRYTGYWWQTVNTDPTSTTHRIIYEIVDDNNVDLIYITPSCVPDSPYDTYRYPKPGTPNSRLHLKMVEFTIPQNDNEKARIVHKSMLNSFYDLFDWYEYLLRAGWTRNGKHFYAQIMDRLQMRSAIVLIPLEYFVNTDTNDISDATTQDTDNNNVYLIVEQKSNTWINAHNTMYLLAQDDPSKLSFITANDESKFLHLYQHTVSLERKDFTEYTPGVLKSTLNSRKQLTDGEWCVEWKENVFVDEENELVYFIGYKNPLESQLFVVNINEPLKIKQVTPSGFSHSISMKKDCSMFVTVCSNITTQNKAFVYQIINQKHGLDKLNASQLAQFNGCDDVRMMEISGVPSELNSTLIDDFLKPPQIFKLKTNDNCELYGMIYMPYNYTPNVKYPTVLHVYAGPRVQLISNAYKANKFIRLHALTLLGYCVVVIDSRGTDYRGVEFESHLRHRLGTVEIEDQVAGLQYAANTYQSIDMNRIAIFGWSYGGYMSLMGLAQRPDIFRVAVSGAPVTDWELYDTAYTERYMSLPAINKAGYGKGSVLNWAKSFPPEENRLLIIHGMIDENVHFAHTRKLIDTLIKENKPYQLQVYPNERHGIRSPEASIHCDLNLYSFLEQHL